MMTNQKSSQILMILILGILTSILINGFRTADRSDKDLSLKKDNTVIDSVNRTAGIVNNNGIKLYYEIVGSGKDTIIFLHGTPSTMYAFVNDLDILSNHFTMIFYDQRGGGRSSLILDPDSLTWQENIKDLEAIRAHFNITKLNLMGISWGSALAVLYANDYLEYINSLILFPMPARKEPDVPRNAEPRAPLLDSVSVKRMDELLNDWESSDDPIAICEEYWSILSSKLYHDSTYVQRIKGSFCQEPPEVMRYTWRVSEARLESLGDFDLRPILKKINSPSLIIKGTSTRMYPEWSEEWAAWLPNSRMLWVDESGYFPWVEKPEIIVDACIAFFNGDWPIDAKIIDKESFID